MTPKIDRLFGSKTRVSLLTKLLLNPDKTFYIRELSKELNIPYGMLYKEEKNLVSLGIVNEEKKGKVTIVSVNESLPYLNELKNLMIKTVGLGSLLRDTFSQMKEVRFALIYGSFATGDVSGVSDVDLLIVGDAQEEKVLSAIGDIEREVGREVNYILWSEKEFTKKVKNKHHLLVDIASKPLIVVVGDEDEFRRTLEK